MESLVGPVLIVAVNAVCPGMGERCLHAERARAFPIHIDAGERRLLCVAPGLIGQRDPIVVERKRVVTVREIDEAEHPVDRQSLADLPTQLATDAELVTLVSGIRAEKAIVDEAVAGMRLQRKTHRDALAQRPGHHAVQRGCIVVGSLDAETRFELLRWRPRSQIDEPGQGIGAETCPLRPTKHFDLLDVEQAGCGRGGRHVDAVDEHAHRRIQRLDELAAFAYASYLKEPGA